jgi:hypothetical protein
VQLLAGPDATISMRQFESTARAKSTIRQEGIFGTKSSPAPHPVEALHTKSTPCCIVMLKRVMRLS